MDLIWSGKTFLFLRNMIKRIMNDLIDKYLRRILFEMDVLLRNWDSEFVNKILLER